ncbi:hypothetical protein GQX74_004550 [Glossina fuscipes]|nr:hypothetical protein GQX74_004550 [Glossina fuscipes]
MKYIKISIGWPSFVAVTLEMLEVLRVYDRNIIPDITINDFKNDGIVSMFAQIIHLHALISLPLHCYRYLNYSRRIPTAVAISQQTNTIQSLAIHSQNNKNSTYSAQAGSSKTLSIFIVTFVLAT